jgi:hypothetical protein
VIARPTLSANALTSLESARAYVGRDDKTTDADDDLLIRCINRATGVIEAGTGHRKLKSRNYDSTTSLTGTWTVAAGGSAQSVTVASTSALRAGDDMVAVGLAAGSRVQSITNATTFVLDRIATAAGTGVAMTAGSERMTLDGAKDFWTSSERQILQIPERPVEAVWAVSWIDDSGVETALNLTGARLEDRWGGTYRLINDVLPNGYMNIRVSCQAGFRPATATDLGLYPDCYEELSGACERLVQVMFQDKLNQIGRGVTVSAGAGTFSTSSFKMPADVQEVISRYKRIW